MSAAGFTITTLVDQLEAESDRGAALLAASFVNEALKRKLLAHFRHRKPGRELLDDANAPLAGFSAAAKACRALDLVTEEQYRRLLVLRQLRNDFAHAWDTLHFSTPGVQKQVKSLGVDAPSLRKAFEKTVIELLRDLGVDE
ncbi:MAG: hypothetical protein R3270_01165 [Gammaproteobacteria bacterium]|nr:hypothetical protein [Gammaproteobacteria bacterium]